MGTIIGFFIISMIFLGVGSLLLWKYFGMKKTQPKYDEMAKNYHPGSFKGFWYRNRLGIIIFLSVVFIILSIAFITPIIAI